MSKKLIFTASLVAASLVAQAQDVLVVNGADGTRQEFALKNFDRLTFNDEETSMNVIMLTGESTEVQLADMRNITFEDEMSGVKEVATDTQFLLVDRSTLRVNSSETLLGVTIYDINGRTVASLKPQAGSQSVDVALSGIESGVNVIVAKTAKGQVSRKFIIQ